MERAEENGKASRILIFGISLFLILLSLDTISSIIGLNQGLIEANIFAVNLIGLFGIKKGLIIKSIITAITFLSIIVFSEKIMVKSHFSSLITYSFILYWAIITIQNFMLIF